MSLLLRCLVALFLTFAVSAPAEPQAQAQAGGEAIAIVGADVLPMTGPERLRDQTVIVRGDRIVAVGPRARVAVPAGARRIEARGMTLMPGLVDMHVHLAPVPGAQGDAAQRAMAVMLAHGVTTARGMAGSPNNLAVREAVERGMLAGPRFYAAAPGLAVNNTPTPEAARQAVAAARAAGYDLIKSHHILDPAVWQAVQDEAQRQRLPTAGHVLNPIGLERAMTARQQVEHLDGVIFALLPQGSAARQIDFAQIPPAPVIAAASTIGDADIAALARRARAAGSWHVPTLALFERIADVATPTEQLMRLPEMRYVPDATLANWSNQRAQMGQGFTAENGQAFRDLRRRIVRAFHAAGVPMMAGSDTAQAFVIWGPGLIGEIRALHFAGLPRMAALRAATVVPRDYFRSLPNGGSTLGWRADFGTVSQGARADLILLSGDPSRDLAALDRPQLVIAAGRAYDRPTLDRMLDQASRDAKAQQPQPAPPAPAAAAAASLPQSIYVMRHLQAGQGQDPGLTEQGQAQARQLVQFFAANRPTAIYATPFRRSQESAAPLAAALGLQVRTYDPSNPQALMQALAAERGPVLIVGHSNTVPDIVAMLGGARPGQIAHDRHGEVWHVSGPQRQVERMEIGQ